MITRSKKTLVLSLVSVLVLTLLQPALASSGSASSRSTQETPIGWWVEWLDAVDKDGNRIEDDADALAARRIQAGRPDSSVPVLVWFQTPPADLDGFLGTLGAGSDAFVFKTQPLVDLNIPARNLHLLSSAPGVAAVQYDRPMHPFLEVSAPATQANRGSGAHTFYNGRTAEDLGYTGQGMTVAVLDSGVQDQHAAFAGKWIAGTDVAPQIPAGTCFNAVDDEGHGTHVASTAVGKSGTQRGTAMDAKLVEVKIAVAGATAQIGPATVGSINRGFEFVKLYNDRLAAGTPLCGANDDHIDVATLSFGSLGRGGPNAGTTEPLIDALVDSGVAVTVAVGNCGPSPSATCTFGDDDNGISLPGNAAGAIGVASFNDGNTVARANDTISSFSSRGPNNSAGATDAAAGGATSASNLVDRYRKPDIAAPGENIAAAGPVPFTGTSKSGTSMAAPHVAGIAALLLQAGEEVKAQTGGENLMASTGNGYVGDNYSLGAYPVRDAIVHSAEYKSAGAKTLWTGPNSRGVQWNNAWGYGQVDAFGALCWAWNNVLVPGGATPPASVSTNCALGGSTSPSPTPSTSSSPSASPTACSTAPATGEGTATRYYLHGPSGLGNVDATNGESTFDTNVPTAEAYSEFYDPPILGNSGTGPGDPSWSGSVGNPINKVDVTFWANAPVGQALGEVNFDVIIWARNAAGTNVQHTLGTATATFEPSPFDVPVKVTATFDKELIADGPDDGTELDAIPLNVDTLDQPITFTIRSKFLDEEAGATIVYDSVEYPANFSVTSGGAAPQPTCSPSTSPSASPSPTPTDDPTTPPPPTGECGTYPTAPSDSLFVDAGIVDETSGGQWGLRKVNAPQAWQEDQATGCGVRVAVLDSGIDVGAGNDLHPDFQCPGKVEILGGSDFIQNDGTPNDEYGHGTHVAGIIGACTDNGTGVAGVAPDAGIVPIRVLDATGGGNADNLAKGIRKATDSGAHVINMSLGFPSAVAPVELVDHLFPDIDAAIEDAVSKGVVVIAAAGNESFPLCAIPSIAEDVVCVGSSDTRDLNSWYGNFPVKDDDDDDGPEESPVNLPLGPGLLAPGGSGIFGNAFCQQSDEEIISTWIRAGDTCGDAGYEAIFGTSMAAPHVAGTAALVYNRLNGERTAANGRKVVDAIIGNTQDLYAPGWDPLSGYGRLDALAAVTSVDPVAPAPTAAVTTTEFTAGSATAGQFSDAVDVAAKVVRTDTGAALAGAEVTFELIGDGGTQAWPAVTDENGVATQRIELGFEPGSYVLNVRYAGEESLFTPSADLTGFVIDRDDSETALATSGSTSKRTFTADVAEADSATRLAGVEVRLLEDGVSIATGTTNEQGVAVFSTKTKKKSLYEVVFGGDSRYVGSSASFIEK